MKIVRNRTFVYIDETVTQLKYTLFIGHYLREEYHDHTYKWFHAGILPYRLVDIMEQEVYLESTYNTWN